MAEDILGGKIIMKLATAYRKNFPENEKSKQISSATLRGAIVEAEDFNLKDISKSFEITENGDTRSFPGGDETTWDKVFMKLRPPSKSPKSKPLSSGVKFLNRTCEEIVDIIKPFSRNEKQNEGKMQTNESCRFISQSDPFGFGSGKET